MLLFCGVFIQCLCALLKKHWTIFNSWNIEYSPITKNASKQWWNLKSFQAFLMFQCFMFRYFQAKNISVSIFHCFFNAKQNLKHCNNKGKHCKLSDQAFHLRFYQKQLPTLFRFAIFSWRNSQIFGHRKPKLWNREWHRNLLGISILLVSISSKPKTTTNISTFSASDKREFHNQKESKKFFFFLFSQQEKQEKKSLKIVARSFSRCDLFVITQTHTQ